MNVMMRKGVLSYPLKGEGSCNCRFVRREDFGIAEQLEWCALHDGQRKELDRLRKLAKNLLDPEMYGYAVSAEVRDAARVAMCMSPVETRDPPKRME